MTTHSVDTFILFDPMSHSQQSCMVITHSMFSITLFHVQGFWYWGSWAGGH